MNGLANQLFLYACTWLFWFIVFYVFVHFFQRRFKKNFNRKQQLIIAAVVALLVTTANIAVSVVLKLRAIIS